MTGASGEWTASVPWRIRLGMARMGLVVWLMVVGALAWLPACASSREMQLRRKADRVETQLRAEQKRVLAMPGEDAARGARLAHLDELRTSLSAANVALGTVSDYVPSTYRGTAYDVLDEVYGTIEWNIPLGPGQAKRAMPRQFQGGALRFD